MMTKTCFCAAGVLLCLLLTAATTNAQLFGAVQESDQQFIDGLRQRGLFDLADRFCRSRLGRQPLTPDSEATLVMELMRTQMSRAQTISDAGQRAVAWEQSRRVADQFLEERGGHPHALLIRVQQGLSLIAEGSLLAQELVIRPTDNELRELATQRLRTARMLLDDVQRDVARQIPLAPRVKSTDGALIADELRALNNNLKFHIAQCHILRAELSPHDEITRLDSLQVAGENLDEVLRQVDSTNSLWWSVQLARVGAWRMAGQVDRATELFRELEVHQVPATLNADYWVARLELATVGYDPDGALAWWRSEAARGTAPPRVVLAALQLLLEQASRGSLPQRELLLAEANQLTRDIETNYGPYWGRLAETYLVGGAGMASDNPSTDPNTSLEILVRVGDAAAREKRTDDALDAYEKAQQHIQLSDNAPAAWQAMFTVQLKISALLEQRGEYDKSSRQLAELARRQPNHDLADTVHLRAVWCLAQASAKQADLKSNYRQSLVEHIDTWPQRPTSDQARIWLARVEAEQGPSVQVIDWLSQVRSDGPQAAAAARELATMVPEYLELVARKNPSVLSSELQRMNSLLRRRLLDSRSENAPHTDATWYLQIGLGRLAIRFRFGDVEQLVRDLEAGLGIVPAIEDERILALAKAQWLALRAAAGSLPADAPNVLADIQQETHALYECLRSLEYLSEDQATDNTVEWRLQIVEVLLGKPANESSRTALLVKKSQLWRRQGRIADAIDALKELVRQFPRRLDVQRELALTMMEDAQNPEPALAQWRAIAAGTQEHTDPWYEAKYYVAKLLLASGQRDQARQMLEYLRAVPPGWDRSPLRTEFEHLLRLTQ